MYVSDPNTQTCKGTSLVFLRFGSTIDNLKN